MPSTAPPFRPLPLAMIERMLKHARALGAATSAHEALAAIFLLHAETKDAEEAIRSVDITQPLSLDE